jgi:hypothetical protein
MTLKESLNILCSYPFLLLFSNYFKMPKVKSRYTRKF